MHGNQWIRWDKAETRYRKRRLMDWVPTPVTNKFAETGERLVAVISRVIPNWLFVPATDDYQDVAAAAVGKKLEPVICEENRIEYLRESTARWLTYTGNCYLLSGAEQITEPPEIDMEAIAERMAADGITPDQLQANPEALQALMPPPEYRLYTDVLSPFEVYVNQSIPNLEDQERILICQRRDVEWVKSRYGVEVEADDPEGDVGLHYLESLGHITEDVLVADYAYNKDQKLPRVTVKRLFVRPCPDYPEGLVVVTANKRLLESLPLFSDGRKRVVTLVHMRFDPVPGAHYGRTPMNDVVFKQIQRNQLESLIQLIVMRMASPVWVVSSGTQVKTWDVGAPGSVLEWNGLGDKNAKPDRIPGEQIPSSLLALLDKIDADIESLASTFEAIKGEAPFSGVPGVVVQQLIEQGMSRFGPAFRNIAEGWREWMGHQVLLFKEYATTPRMLRIMGDNAQWKVEQFSKADVAGAVDVRIESESTVPRSEQFETAKIMEAAMNGLIDVMNPLTNLKVLKKLGMTDMAGEIDKQKLFAVKENEAIAQGELVPVNQFLDDHEVHIACHREAALNEEAAQPVEIPGVPVVDELGMPVEGQWIDPPRQATVRDLLVEHIRLHIEMGMQEQALLAPAPMPGEEGGPPGSGGGEGGSAPPTPPAGEHPLEGGALA